MLKALVLSCAMSVATLQLPAQEQPSLDDLLA